MRTRALLIAFVLIGGAAWTIVQLQGVLAQESAEVPADELRGFAAIFLELKENAAGFPGTTPPGGERRESVEIIEEHGWTLEQYNRLAARINSDPELFQRFSEMVEEASS
jgi:hypothetical protein